MIEPVRVLGQPAMRLRAPDGAEATVLLHGAHTVSWVPAGGEEQLYLSPTAVAGPGQAVRGGIPVVFPQFARRGPIPLQHGFGRTAPWQWVEGASRSGVAIGVLRLTDSEASRALWPQRFEAELTLVVSGRRLDVELAVTNTGEAPFEFTAALHNYLRVNDLLHARLHGLWGLHYEDVVQGEDHLQELDPIGFVDEVDRIYRGLRVPLQLSSALGRLTIETEGFPDAVVWNPGEARAAALADLPDDDWCAFLCVEAAAVAEPVLLAPGQTWVARQGLEAA